MFRPQAQAETHSRPAGGLPRTSPPTHAETHSNSPWPITYFTTDSRRTHTASSVTITYFTEASKVLQFCNTYFFYLCLDYKHKHTTDQAAFATWFTQRFIFLFINRLQAQAQARNRPGWPRAFLLTAHKI